MLIDDLSHDREAEARAGLFGREERVEHLRQLRRVDAVGNLAASVLHDFNNLMTPIVCSSALLERAVAHQEHATGLAREIREAAERAAERAAGKKVK